MGICVFPTEEPQTSEAEVCARHQGRRRSMRMRRGPRKGTQLSRFALSLLAGWLFVAGAQQTPAQQANNKTLDHSANKPEALGFSSERLERLHAAMQREVKRM